MTTPSEEKGVDPVDRGAPLSEEAPPGDEVSVERIQLINLCLIALTAAASLFFSVRFAVGVVSGGVLMAVNFRILVGVIRAVLRKGEEGGSNLAKAGVYWAKFLGVMALVAVCVLVFRVDVFGFLVGLSTLLVAILLEAMFRVVAR